MRIGNYPFLPNPLAITRTNEHPSLAVKNVFSKIMRHLMQTPPNTIRTPALNQAPKTTLNEQP
jgi:hypothetical protein